MKRLLVILLILSAFSANAQQSNKYEAIADSLERLGQSDKLIPFFLNELKLHPKSEDVLRWLGHLYIEDKKPELGEKYYREALKVDPSCGMCYMNIGRAYAIRNDSAKTFEYLDKAIETEPGNAYLYAIRSSFRNIIDNSLGAMLDINKAIKLEPTNADYYHQRGMLNTAKRYYDAAISDLDKAIGLGATGFDVFYRRAMAYNNKQMYTEAMADINKAIELDSTMYDLYEVRGEILGFLKEHKKAIAEFTRSIQLNPDNVRPYYNRALNEFAIEDMEAFCADLHTSLDVIKRSEPNNSLKEDIESELASKCDSSNPGYYFHRAASFTMLSQFQNAINICSGGLKRFPGNIMITMLRGNAYFELKKNTEAISDFYEVVKHPAEIHAGYRETNLDKTEEEIDHISKTVLGVTYLRIAEGKFYEGDLEKALHEINTAIQISPKTNDVGIEALYTVRGDILLTLGKVEAAKNNFDTAIQFNPSFVQAYTDRAIAAINLTTTFDLKPASINTDSDNKPFKIIWELPANLKIKETDANIMAAMNDCNKAIELDPQYEITYYIRGVLKKTFKKNDYCVDLLKAKQLGFSADQKIFKDCGK